MDPFSGVGREVERVRLSGIEFPFSSDAPTDQARDLVRKLLRPNPRERLSANEALNHIWFMIDDEVLEAISLEFAYGGIVYY